MDSITSLFPEQSVMIALAVLTVLRAMISMIDAAVAESTSIRDDARWAKIRGNFWFLMFEKAVFYALGITFPKKK